MKIDCVSLVNFLIIVLLKTEFLESSNTDDPSKMGVTMSKKKVPEFESYLPSTTSTTSPTVSIVNDCPIPRYGIYIMGFTIGVLFLIIIGLLILLYKLKYKVYSESIGDKIEITKTDSSPKYTRHLSSEPSNVTDTPENSTDNGRFKLQRQGSKMTIVDYPICFNTNEKKSEHPSTSTVTLTKVMHQQQVPIQRDRMREICQGVLEKAQRLNASTTSLSNLEKILNEDKKAKKSDNYGVTDKSASTGLLDVVEDFKILPSPKPAKKSNVFPDHIQTNANLLLQNIKIGSNKGNEAVVEDDIYDNPPQSNRRVKSSDSDDEIIDEIYDNPPNSNRPVSNINCEQMDDIYDNPPNMNRPVMNDNDIYDDVPNNRHSYVVNDNPQSNKPVFASSSKQKTQADEENNGDQYDFPPSSNDKEIYFNAFYTNARSLNQTKEKVNKT